jgi:hypothetical protein
LMKESSRLTNMSVAIKESFAVYNIYVILNHGMDC